MKVLSKYPIVTPEKMLKRQASNKPTLFSVISEDALSFIASSFWTIKKIENRVPVYSYNVFRVSEDKTFCFDYDTKDIDNRRLSLLLIKDLSDLKIKVLIANESFLEQLSKIDISQFYLSVRATLPDYPPLVETYYLRMHPFSSETVKYKQEIISLADELGKDIPKFLNRHVPYKSVSSYKRVLREHAADHILLNQNNQEGIRIN